MLLNTKCWWPLRSCGKQQQYSTCNCLLLHGIPEKKQENTDEMCIKAINEHLDLDINDRDIDRTHRIEILMKNQDL